MSFTYKYPRPALTVDILLFQKKNNNYSILLIQRDKYPFEGSWALPGGFVDMDERLENAAQRELFEETNIEVNDLKQFHTFDDINRDPRHRTISVVFFQITENLNLLPIAASDARDAKFFSINNLPNLAFDHKLIIAKAIKKILKKGY